MGSAPPIDTQPAMCNKDGFAGNLHEEWRASLRQFTFEA